MDENLKKQLKIFACKARIGAIDGIYCAKAGHPGGSLSICDLLSYLYNVEMNVDPKNPQDPKRDRLVLSKGHAAPALYATLALKGYFPVEDLKTLRKSDSYLQGHPNMNKVPGVDMSTGSLGQGISCAVGMALGGKIDKENYRVYTILGDGEIEEGIIWEAAMTSAHFKLDNLTLIIDHNKLQLGGTTEDVMNIMPIDAKFRDFHWHTITINGYDFTQIKSALQEALAHKGQPTVIIAETVKGKGVDFMENNKEWHNKALDAKDAATALKELGGEG